MQHKDRLTKFLGLVLVGALALSGCFAPKPTGDSGKGDSEGVKKPAVGGELVYHVPDDPDTLAIFWVTSAYGASVTDRVFGEGLIRIGFDLKPEAALAEALPIVSSDQKTYTFKIRKGIKFQDGQEVTAKDFNLAYQILMDKEYAGRWKSSVAPIESIKVVDDYTLEFTTKEVFAPFLFGSGSIPPLPSHLIGTIPVKDLASHDFWRQPVGAGPYKLAEWKSGQYVLMERFDGYYEAGMAGPKKGIVGPWYEKVRQKVINEDNTALAALESGELTLYSSMPPQHVEDIKAKYPDQLQAYDWNRMGYGYQTFNNDLYPTTITEVRQALSYALDRNAILQGVMDNKATIPAGFVPPIHWVFDKSISGYAYSPAKAEELLQKAGFKKNGAGIYEKDGKPLKIRYIGTKGSTLIEGIALQSQKDWKSIGVETELIFVDFNTLLDKHLKPGDFHVTFSGLGFSVDPHFSFDAFHSKNIRLDSKGINTGSNSGRYQNAEVDKLIDEGKTTVDVAKRLAIYQKAQRLIVEDAPANWIYVNKYTDFVKKEVKGVVLMDGYGASFQNQWYVKEQ